MKNVQIIEYSGGFQVKLYWYSDEVLMGYYLSDDDKEKRKRKRELRERWEREQWTPDKFTEIDLDWEEIWQLQEQGRKETAAKNAARAKKNIYYLARSNEWEWFVTLTLDKEKIDRYDYDEVSKRVKKWFDNLKQRKAPDMYYIIVPERHKDGAWHFHGLIGGCSGLTFVNSGKRTSKASGRQIIYNFEDWKFGFSTATKVKDTERVSGYICKYITKDMCEATVGKRRYWYSLNCKKAPISEYHLSDRELIEYKNSLYDNMTYCKRFVSEFCTVDYIEVSKGD